VNRAGREAAGRRRGWRGMSGIKTLLGFDKMRRVMGRFGSATIFPSIDFFPLGMPAPDARVLRGVCTAIVRLHSNN